MKKYKAIFTQGSLQVYASNKHEARRIAAGEYFSLPSEYRPKGDIEDIVEISPFEQWLHTVKIGTIEYTVFSKQENNAKDTALAIVKLPTKSYERLNAYCNYESIDEDEENQRITKITSYCSALADVEIISQKERELILYHFRMVLSEKTFWGD